MGRQSKLGVWIKAHLSEVEEDYISHMHQLYRDSYKGKKTERGRLYRYITYRSFHSYIRNLIKLGLVEYTGRTEISDHPLVEHFKLPAGEEIKRVFIRLTERGWALASTDPDWANPVKVLVSGI